MDVIEECAERLAAELRKDEDRKLQYLLTGKIPEEFECPNCRERSKREDLKEQLQKELIERSKLNVEIIKAQLGCGTLNTDESQ